MEKHQKENPSHHTHFSIHDAAYWCDDCEWTEILPFSEAEIDMMMEESLLKGISR